MWKPLVVKLLDLNIDVFDDLFKLIKHVNSNIVGLLHQGKQHTTFGYSSLSQNEPVS